MVSQNPIDPNNLLEQEQPRRLSRRTITLWLVALSLMFFFVPLYFVLTAMRSDAARLEANIQAAQESLAHPSTPVPENQELMDELAQVQGLANQIEGAYSNVEVSHTDWPAVMAAIGNYDPARITLTSLTQADKRVTLNGRATDDTVVVAYAHALEGSGLFSRVVVQSLKMIATSATATLTSTAGTPTATPITPTTTVTPAVTLTPTPGVRDKYEVDDFEPRVIVLGQPQLHNFYPIYDVDNVKFLAKAGRYYRVFTSDLATGVDTFLAVSLGSIRHTNDDYQPGALSSEVLFQVGSSDADAIVRTTNRGQYGPDKWYQVAVEEVIPTPTPTFTPTPTPTLTSTPPPTPTPADTPTPAPTLAPTPDLCDEYEPDGTDPKPIAIEETQAHNLYPDGDVDKVTFGVTAGLFYALGTSNLSPGTDTKIKVEINGDVCEETDYYRCENDNVGPGSLESEVRFVPDEDGSAVATISKGASGQYGADKTYNLTLNLLSVDVDRYEPDDVNPKPIAIGETQAEHNFYPPEDIDKVKFKTKAENSYRIFTSDLEPGVDTFLTVTLTQDGTIYYTKYNDDREQYDPSSEVVLDPTMTLDGWAIVEVTNRGQYGPDKQYSITVEWTSSSSRLPGVAALIPSLALARPVYSLPVMAGQAHILSPSSLASGGQRASRVFSPEAVEFVIVLELK